MVFAFATDGQTVHYRIWAIVRNWNEQITKLEPDRKSKGDYQGFGGWMIGLLGEPTEFV